ncbi:MAG: dihydropteroate synthase [Ruminococcaceae bacterium]|jgi:dihydropteroate synthase|nr:dihydropteroate synthase [Oscillospiraceae bacterium]
MNCFGGKGFSFPLGEKTYIMGILNITEDSFFDGGRYVDKASQLKRADKICLEGADIIDIGAQSTRPGHTEKTAEEEISLLSPVLKRITERVDIPVSVDTFYPSVAEFALENGAKIINDVSGVFNEKMAEVVKKYNAGWIITHTGESDSSTELDYGGKVVESVNRFFDETISKCLSFGIYKNQIMLDMGIGFGKGNDDNLELIRNINLLKRDGIALMTALSCKRVIKNTSLCEGEDLVYGTISANTAAIMGKTDFIRVHHVKENVLAARTADAIFRR